MFLDPVFRPSLSVYLSCGLIACARPRLHWINKVILDFTRLCPAFRTLHTNITLPVISIRCDPAGVLDFELQTQTVHSGLIHDRFSLHYDTQTYNHSLTALLCVFHYTSILFSGQGFEPHSRAPRW